MIKKYSSVKVSHRLLESFKEKAQNSRNKLNVEEQKSTTILSPFGKSNIFTDLGEKTLNTFGYGFNMLGNGLK